MQDKIDHLVLVMLENRSLYNVLGWLYADDQPRRFVGADTSPPYQGLQTGMGPAEFFVNQVYDALIANAEAWKRTLLIITFDEHGGTYDHVDPGWGAVTPDAHRGPDGFAFDRYRVRVPTLLISPWIAAGTVFRSPSATLKLDHTSIVATAMRWCGVAPDTAGLGDRVAVAPTLEDVLAQQIRTDVPTFSVPDGYADQGKDCWITDEAQRLEAGVMRSVVARSATIEDLEARMSELERR